MRKDALEWEYQNEERHHQEETNVVPTRNWARLTFLYVLNATNPCFRTTFVPIVELTKGRR